MHLSLALASLHSAVASDPSSFPCCCSHFTCSAMNRSEHRYSLGASMMQAKGINKRRKKKDAAPPVAKKQITPPISVLFDRLESYDQVLSFAFGGKLHLCSIPDIHCDYVEKNFSVLSRVLFQTRYSSLKTGDTVITAVVLEDSEVVQDLAALQWLEGASKGLLLSSLEEGTGLGESQPDCVSDVNLDGLSNDLVESAAAISALKTFQPAHISSHSVEMTTDLVELAADDCYRPDMSMIVMLESIQARSSPSTCSPDQRGVLPKQEEEIQVMNGPFSQLDCGLRIQPSMPLVCFEEQPPQLSRPLSNYDNTGSARQEEQVAQNSHTSLANVEIFDARAKLESEEEDMIEKIPPFICKTLENSYSIMCKLPFISGGVTKIPAQNHGMLPLQVKNHRMLEPEAKQLTQRDCEEVTKIEEQSSYSSVSSSGLLEEPAQPCPPLSDSGHSAIASQEIHQVEIKSESEEEFGLVQKLAMEALELSVLHGLFEDDDLSDIELLDETTSERSMRVMANVHNFVDELEEDQSSNSCQFQEVQVHSPLHVVPSPQHTSSAEGNSVGFLGLPAQVSNGHSNVLRYSNCNLEEQHGMFNTEARSCAKRLVMENEAEGSPEEGEENKENRSCIAA